METGKGEGVGGVQDRFSFDLTNRSRVVAGFFAARVLLGRHLPNCFRLPKGKKKLWHPLGFDLTQLCESSAARVSCQTLAQTTRTNMHSHDPDPLGLSFLNVFDLFLPKNIVSCRLLGPFLNVYVCLF